MEIKNIHSFEKIHGGPHMMYANTYVHEFQTLANEGYTILFTNPRGSVGYGQDS